jgi:aryl-alcohol dehydrogenase-like predicted oxidoreductase
MTDISPSLDTYRLLGRSGLRVSPLSLGAMTFGSAWGWGFPHDMLRRPMTRGVLFGGVTIAPRA